MENVTKVNCWKPSKTIQIIQVNKDGVGRNLSQLKVGEEGIIKPINPEFIEKVRETFRDFSPTEEQIKVAALTMQLVSMFKS